MSVLRILKIGLKPFNKAGYRLSSVVSLPVPQQARELGVHTIKKTTINHITKGKKFVETWLDKNGKVIKTIHGSGADYSEQVVTSYKWFEPRVFNEADTYDIYLKRENPYAFENITGFIQRSFLVRPKGESKFKITKRIFTNLDINKAHRTVTKGVGTIDGKINTSEIYNIQHGKRGKYLKLTAEKQVDGTYKTIDTDYSGISKEDAQYIFSDEYFHSRFLSPLLMAKCCVSQAAKKQGVSYIPKLVKSQYPKYRIAYEKQIGLSKDILDGTTIRTEVVDTLNHESKHLRQYELVEKYINGELKNPQEIELAKKYKESLDKYISILDNPEKYMIQFVEEDAYNAGWDAKGIYYDITLKLRRLFDFSSWHSAGI